VIKLKKYTHLTLEEREKLFGWIEKDANNFEWEDPFITLIKNLKINAGFQNVPLILDSINTLGFNWVLN